MQYYVVHLVRPSEKQAVWRTCWDMSVLGWGTGIRALAPEGLRGKRHLEKPTDSPVSSRKDRVAGESLGFLDT